MTSEWVTATIADIAEKVAMGPFGSSIKVETFVPQGVPVISGQHLHSFRLDERPGFNFITPEHAAKLSNANVRQGDVIFTHAGNIGQVSYIPTDSAHERYVISQRQFYMRCDSRQVIPEFVTYYFATPYGKHQLLANSASVGVPSLAQPVSYLRTVGIRLPPLHEQRAIACILGALDDKIELNRKMNETVEGIARAIFKSWFVDFDPVRARAEGRDTGLPSEIADLFPSSFVDSELGEIPEGWEVSTLGGLCPKPQYGYTASAQTEPIGPHLLRITDINKRAWVNWHTVPFCTIEQDIYPKYQVKEGDVLVARMADPGHGAVVEGDHNAVFASYLIRFRPTERWLDRYLQYWLRSEAYWGLVRGRQAGTTRATLNAQVLGEFPILHPATHLLQSFKRIVDALRARVVVNAEQNTQLEELRDSLLPKLISGELRVPDAERIVGRCV